MSTTGKDYIEFLEKKNFKLSGIIFDPYIENNKVQDLYTHRIYTSNNNNKVSVEMILYCIDIYSFNENIPYSEDDLCSGIKYKEIDKKINYDWFYCESIIVYGEINIIDSFLSLNETLCGDDGYKGGIGLIEEDTSYQNINPFYRLNLKNLEEVLYIQDCQDKTPHINFLLQNYIYYCNKIIDPVIKPVMESIGAVCKSYINLITNTIENNEIRLDFLKKEEEFYEEVSLFSVYIDFLYGNLYGVIQTQVQSGMYIEKEYINLNEITKEELIRELNKYKIIN